MKLTPETRAQLKTSHPNAVILRTTAAPDNDFVFELPGVPAFDAFLGAVNGEDPTAKVYAHRSLAYDCAVWPSRSDMQALGRERPGLVHTLGDELAKRAGLRAEVLSEAL